MEKKIASIPPSTVVYLICLALFCLAAKPIRILLDRGPTTLNPRQAIDLPSQRLVIPLFSGLTKTGRNLELEPGLAKRWWSGAGGKSWHFEIAASLRDHQGVPITPRDIVECLEQYRIGKPTSILKSSFPTWIGTRLVGATIEVSLSAPDVFFPRNASALRYFRNTDPAPPCSEPKNTPIIGSGPWRPLNGLVPLRTEFDTLDVESVRTEKIIRLLFVRDETTRALMLLRQAADATLNGLPLMKTRWMAQKRGFCLKERSGTTLSYLGFNLRHPALSDARIRKALSIAIDRYAIVRGKMFNFGALATSLLPPVLPEAWEFTWDYNPPEAERLLDEAGFPRGTNGMRQLVLHYQTTPVREGYEQALVFQDMWKKIGLDIRVTVLDQGTYLARLQSGQFDLFSTRWIGISDASLLQMAFGSKSSRNRVGFRSKVIDALLEDLSRAHSQKRIEIAREIQQMNAKEFVYFPLWFWNNALVSRCEILNTKNVELSQTGALQPLEDLEFVP